MRGRAGSRVARSNGSPSLERWRWSPSCSIADEATSALDVVVQAVLLDLLAELRASTGITLVCITHDLDLVRYLCDSAVVMRQVESSSKETSTACSPHPPTRTPQS